MARSKIIINGETYIDLTSDTVAANSLLNGVTAHNNAGTLITGTVSFVTYYTGASDPSASIGSDGDIYLKTVS